MLSLLLIINFKDIYTKDHDSGFRQTDSRDSKFKEGLSTWYAEILFPGHRIISHIFSFFLCLPKLDTLNEQFSK